MHIALIHHHYLQRGGEDAVFEAERELLSRRHRVTAYTTSSRDLPQQPLLAAQQSIWNERQRREVREFLRRERPDVVHVHNTFPLLSPAVLRAVQEAGVPLVQTLHNYRLLCVNGLLFRDGHVCEECVGRFPLPGVRHACYRGSVAASAAVAGMLGLHRVAGTWNAVDVFVALTDFARAKLVQGGVPEDRIVVKPNFTGDAGAGGGQGGYALFVGRLSEEKGIETLLRAWQLVGSRLPLRIVGDGPLAEQARAQATAGVSFLGALPPEQVRQLMKEAHLLVFPSEWYEGMPMTILEAFSTGTPVIGANLGAASSLVIQGKTGRRFSTGDPVSLSQQVLWSLDHPSEWLRMREHARWAYTEQYTPQKNLRLLEDLYQRAVTHHAQRRQT